MIRPTLGLFLVASVTMLSAGSCLGESPHRGGTLTQLVEAEPNTLDCHAGGTSYVLELLAPHYSTLLRFDADHYPKIEGDVAQSWTVSSDRLTYTFKLRPNVLFHDGTPLTAEDIKATYDRLRNPPPGVTSVRQGQFKDISAIDVVDPLTISFRLSQPNDSMPVTFASPWNCIYSAKKLSEDAKFPETHVLGTGPFVFIEYEKGSHFLAKRFDRYFRQGEPYLDEYRSIFVSGAGVVSALAGGQADATFLYVAPPDVERIKAARGDRTRFETAPLNVFQFVTLNTKKAPLDDVRVRRALNLAIDRRLGEKELSRITILRNFGSIMPPSSAFALKPEEIERSPGMGTDIAAAREQAKALLAEAGATNLKLKLLNRNIRHPWEPAGIFLIDQWRQIGVSVEMVNLTTAAYFGALTSGNFELALDFNSSISEDPTEILVKYTPGNPNNYSGVTDETLRELAAKQSQSTDSNERRRLVTEFQQRMLDQAYFLPLFWGERTVVLPANLRGWRLLPNTVLNLDMGATWLDQ